MAGPRSSPTNQTHTSGRPTKGDLPSNQQAPTPVRPGKRRHVATISPITARSENRSPRAKQRPHRQSPPTISSAPVSAVAAAVQMSNVVAPMPTTSKPTVVVVAAVPEEVARSGSVSPSQLAVPRVSAEPPCPSALPMPPVHWMANDNKGPTQRLHCRAVTESLLSHLTTSGIMITA